MAEYATFKDQSQKQTHSKNLKNVNNEANLLHLNCLGVV